MKEKTLNKLKERKGISLIVLILTIIVVIILATAVIQSFSNNNPIEKAKEAKFKNDIKVIEEKYALEEINKYFDGKEEEKITINDLTDNEDYIKKFEIVDGKVVLKESEATEEEKEWANKNDIQIKVPYPVIPNGFVKSQVTGETEVDSGLVIYEGEESVTDANVATARTTRNQFVWVPVEDFSKFKRTITYDGTITDPYDWASEPYTSNASEVEEYNKMKESVKKYGGFYIARYEASKSISGKAQFISNQTPWNNITWGTSMNDLDGDGAAGKSRAVYPVASATKEKDAVSTLIYGVQWDAIITFLEKKYPGISQDSTNYGNYSVRGTVKTGSNPEYAPNNIYDICGNLWEWTMEFSNDNGRIFRGGVYLDELTFYPISLRNINPNISNTEKGFRVALYIR